MSSKTNIGDTLTHGIQNVAALLPLLGTEQCEQHVGSALEKGFLYAAAAPLSIFGSLGIVKTAFATLLATITLPICGAKWLDDAGFGTSGSVSSMVTIVKGRAEYGAELSLVKLLENQHIDDLNLVEDVEWSGWQTTTGSQFTNVPEDIECSKVDDPNLIPVIERSGSQASTHSQSIISDVERSDSQALDHYPDLVANVRLLGSHMVMILLFAWRISLSWNMKLILTSMLAALISISPYLYLISSDWTDSHLWLFPLLRAFGSFLCVVAIQLALQLRIHRIIRGRLLLMKATKRGPEGNNEGHSMDAGKWDTLEQHLRKLSIAYDSDLEKAGTDLKIAKGVSDVLSRDWALITYQLILFSGIPMIVVGYVGCFNFVNESTTGGPYVWLGIEAMLLVVRLALWGWNPEWDEGTGMKIKLKLLDDTPLITTPYPLRELKDRMLSFIICNENNFLATATRYTGPLQRFVSSTVSLFYSLVPNGQSKLLLTTILDLHTRTIRTFYVDSTGDPHIFSSKWKLDPRSNAIRVTLGDEIVRNHSRDDVLVQAIDHSKHIASQLCRDGHIYPLDLQWTVSYSSVKSSLGISKIAMNASDGTYAKVGNLFMNKSWFCTNRRDWILHYMHKWEATWNPNEWTELGRGIEVLHILESFILETYLCFKDGRSTQELAKTDTELAHRLSAEWVHEMERRMSKEKEESTKRLDEWKIGDDIKKHIIMMWERASERLAGLRGSAGDIEQKMAEIMEILDKGDVGELIPALFYSSDPCWPSDLASGRVGCALDSQAKWFLRRVRRILQDGIPRHHDVIEHFAHINFAEDPYCYVNDASVDADVLDTIRLNSSLQVIQLDSDLSTSDVEKILEAVAEKDTLMTVIGPNNLVLSADILEKNHHILFLPGRICQPLCTQHRLCDLVCRNQKEWRDRARACSDMTYGFICYRFFQRPLILGLGRGVTRYGWIRAQSVLSWCICNPADGSSSHCVIDAWVPARCQFTSSSKEEILPASGGRRLPFLRRTFQNAIPTNHTRLSFPGNFQQAITRFEFALKET